MVLVCASVVWAADAPVPAPAESAHGGSRAAAPPEQLPGAVRAEIDICVRTFRGFDDDAKKESLQRLVGLGNRTVPYLLDISRHVPETPGIWVVRALRQFRDPAVAYPLMSRYPTASPAMKEELLAAIGASGDEKAVPFLTVALGEDEVSLRRHAATALASFDRPSVLRGLLRALEDEDWWVRREAVTGLRGIADDLVVIDLVDRLIARLPRLHADSRDDAIRVLASLRDPRVVEPLTEYLRLGKGDIRVLCARGLGLIADDRCARALEAAISDDDELVRIEAVRSLAALRGEDAFRALLRRFEEEESRKVQRAIRMSLREVVGRDLGPDPQSWHDWRNGLRDRD